MAEFRITTAPGYLLSGGSGLFGTQVSSVRSTSNGRADFTQRDRVRQGFPQLEMSMGADWQRGADQQRGVQRGANPQCKHVVTDAPTGVPPSAGERRP